jgi:hypothetical protein
MNEVYLPDNDLSAVPGIKENNFRIQCDAIQVSVIRAHKFPFS